MKIGVSAFAWATEFTSAHLSLLSSIREHGLEGFEIPMFDPANLDARLIRRTFEANALECTVCAILPPGINPISSDESTRRKAHRHLVRCIETSAEMGAALVGGPVYAPIGYLPGRRRDQEEWKWAVDCIQELGEVLDRHAITLSIEPVNRSETFLIRTAEEAGAFCDAVAHPRVGVTVDTFHANIEEKSISRSIASLGRRLKHVHISENDRGIPGAGHIDFAAVLAALREQKYDGYLMIEGFGFSAKEPASIGAIWGDPDTSPEDVAFKGADYLRLLLA